MLYIDIINDNSVRFGNAVGGGDNPRYMPITLESMKDEIKRIWMWNTENDAYVLNCYEVGNINLAGTVYSTAEEFVVAFNTAVSAAATTTTTIPATTTTTIPATTTTTIPATTTTTTVASQLLPDLISVWEFDETTGTVAYDAHGSNDGTITGATINQTGKINKCYLFNGLTHRVYRSWTYTYNNNFGWSAWAKFDSLTDNRIMYTNTGTDQMMTYVRPGSGNKIRFYFKDGEGTTTFVESNAAVVIDTWYHVVATVDSNVMKLYINGVLQTATASQSGSITSPMMVIGNDELNQKPLYGLIDQPAVWDRALGQSDVDELYNSGNGLAYSSW